MVVQTIEALPALYEKDETAWLEAMVGLIGERRFEELDYAHLQEYLADMARRDKREVESRLAVCIAHLLKWNFQPERPSGGWRATIEIQRQELARLLESGTLRRYAATVLAKAYADAIRQAVAETELAVSTFSDECPFSLEHLEDPDFLAG